MLEARLHKQDEVCPEHLLLAIARENANSVASLLQTYKVDYKRIVEDLSLGGNINSGLDTDDDPLDDVDDDMLLN